MKEKKTIVYCCTSVYQILILTMMIEIYYRDCRNVLILIQKVADKLELEYLRYYVDEIVVVATEASKYEVAKQFDEICEKENIALFGMFTWGNIGAEIYDSIPKGIPVVLLDEGVATYEYKRYMTCAVGNIDFSRISAIWLLDPKISQNDKQVPEYRIELEQITTDLTRFENYVDKLNRIYGYQFENISADILFFDKYFVQGNCIPVKYDRFVIDSMVRLAGDKKICIKSHPREDQVLAKWRYRGFPVTFYKESSVPWEMVVLNYMYRIRKGEEVHFPQVLIATNTTSLFTTQILLATIEMEIPIIYTNKIIHQYLTKVELVPEKTLESYQAVYKERKVYLPTDWSAYYSALAASVSNLDKKEELLEQILEAEQCLYQAEYLRNIQMRDYLLRKVFAEVWTEQGLMQDYYTYIVGGDFTYKAVFDDFGVNNLGRITIRAFLASIPLISEKVHLQKVSWLRNGKKEESVIDAEYFLTDKKPYVEFEIESAGDEIKEIVFEYEISKKYQPLFDAEQSTRFQGYFGLLLEWVDKLQNENCFKEYCSRKGYRRIGVYGKGKLGLLLQKQLRFTDTEVIMIDKKMAEDSMTVEEAVAGLESFDLIIITPLFDRYNIHKTFGFSEKVIGLDEFLNRIGKG